MPLVFIEFKLEFDLMAHSALSSLVSAFTGKGSKLRRILHSPQGGFRSTVCSRRWGVEAIPNSCKDEVGRKKQKRKRGAPVEWQRVGRSVRRSPSEYDESRRRPWIVTDVPL